MRVKCGGFTPIALFSRGWRGLSVRRSQRAFKARLRGSICVNPIYLYYILFSKKVRVFFANIFLWENKGNFVYKRAGFIISERSRRKKTHPFHVGRGPVPRHATIAGDRPPRYVKKNAPCCQTKNARVTVGRGPVPRQRSGTRPPLLCRSRAPALDPFGRGHSRTTNGWRIVRATQCSRGTGPRATVKKTHHRGHEQKTHAFTKQKTHAIP